MNTSQSLRTHPQLATLFKDAESRFLSSEELELYLSEYPEGELRAKTSTEVKGISNTVVKKVITRIYEIYPYEEKHQLAMAKCVRDVRYVVAYATSSMLMGDLDWYRDKLLIWMKTIIQSFRYPDISPGTSQRYFDDPEVLAHLETLKPHQRSIYETYKAILEEMKANLSPECYEEIEPYLTLALTTLSND